MRVFQTILLILFLMVSVGNGFAQDADAESAKRFFEQYVKLGERFDASMADLFLDSATIKNLRRYPNGLEKTMQLTGAQWKALIIKTMPLAKAKGDVSTFSEIYVSIDGKRAKIKANRYSNLKCYTDTGYYMIIERQPDSEYKIVREYTETQPNSDC
ncbi:MAG: hypothetical protein QNJ26_18590 [Desulfobacterales bacterium]|nr:hypothetical protein [Desulfobacterales bacterium]